MAGDDATDPDAQTFDWPSEFRLLTPVEVAAILRCTPRYIQSEAAAGRIASVKIAGRYMIKPEAVHTYIEACRVKVEPTLSKRALEVAADIRREGRIDAPRDKGGAASRLALKAADELIGAGKKGKGRNGGHRR